MKLDIDVRRKGARVGLWSNNGGLNVRFGSETDMCAAKRDVRFNPNSDHKSRHPQKVMSALPPKADMCSAVADVSYGPQADMPKAAQGGLGRYGAARLRLVESLRFVEQADRPSSTAAAQKKVGSLTIGAMTHKQTQNCSLTNSVE